MLLGVVVCIVALGTMLEGLWCDIFVQMISKTKLIIKTNSRIVISLRSFGTMLRDNQLSSFFRVGLDSRLDVIREHGIHPSPIGYFLFSNLTC